MTLSIKAKKIILTGVNRGKPCKDGRYCKNKGKRVPFKKCCAACLAGQKQEAKRFG